MTDRQVQPDPRARAGAEPRPAPRRRPRALPTVLAALAVFGVAFEFLVFQFKSGHDPAIGAAPAVTRQAKQPVNRRIVITKVVGQGAGGSTSGATAASAAAPSAPAPVATSSS